MIKRCFKCLLPDTYPSIRFDEREICTQCQKHEKRFQKIDYQSSEKKLEVILQNIKRNNNKYDCIIGLSGGKDSSYMTYLAVKKYHLNPICVTFDNGFLSNLANENIKKVINTLNVEHIRYKPDWELMKRLYRHFLLTTGEICTPCNVGIGSLLYDTAFKYQVPNILSGYSIYTDAEAEINIYHISTDYFINVTRGVFSRNEIKEFLHSRTLNRAITQLLGKINYIQMPRYLPWNEEEIVDILKKAMDWRAVGQITTEHGDCVVSPFKEYLLIKEFGFSEKTRKFSTLIRNGFINRKEALEKVEAFEADILKRSPEIIDKIKQILDVTDKDIEYAVKKRQEPYIPNMEKIYDGLIKNETLMRKLIYKY